MALPSASEPVEENHVAGILWMLLTMCLFVSMDTLAKFLTQEFAPQQVAWARFVFHMFWLALFLRKDFLRVPVSASFRMQLIRSSLLMLTTLLFFSGLRTTSLSTASVIMFLSPIFVTVLAIPLLGEQVGIRRWIGVLIGFLGALIIVLPHPLPGLAPDGAPLDVQAVVSDVYLTGVGWIPESGHLFLIAAAACNALYQIMTRRLRVVDSPMTTLFYSGVMGCVIMSAWAPLVWKPPSAAAWGLMMCVGLIGCVSHFCLIRAFRSAPASLVVPFSYSSLLWATMFGYLVFNALPDRWTLVGATLIIGSGLYIFYRETRVKSVAG